jgi:hypothetical protein
MTHERLRMAFDFFDKVIWPKLAHVEPQRIYQPIGDQGRAGPGTANRRVSMGRSH